MFALINKSNQVLQLDEVEKPTLYDSSNNVILQWIQVNDSDPILESIIPGNNISIVVPGWTYSNNSFVSPDLNNHKNQAIGVAYDVYSKFIFPTQTPEQANTWENYKKEIMSANSYIEIMNIKFPFDVSNNSTQTISNIDSLIALINSVNTNSNI
jgi:hypothetical protein